MLPKAGGVGLMAAVAGQAGVEAEESHGGRCPVVDRVRGYAMRVFSALKVDDVEAR